MTEEDYFTLDFIKEVFKLYIDDLDLESLDFLSSEVFKNKERSLKSPKHLQEIIGEHLINLGIKENENKSLDLCEDLHEELLKPPEESEESEVNSDQDLDDGLCELCEREMPLTFHHLIPRTTHKKMLKRNLFEKKELNRGIYVCRPCHNAIHKLIDEYTMAQEYNTLEKLLDHEGVQKWIPYAMKQKVVKEAMKKYKK